MKKAPGLKTVLPRYKGLRDALSIPEKAGLRKKLYDPNMGADIAGTKAIRSTPEMDKAYVKDAQAAAAQIAQRSAFPGAFRYGVEYVGVDVCCRCACRLLGPPAG